MQEDGSFFIEKEGRRLVSNLGPVKPMVWLKSWIMMKKWYKPIMVQKDHKYYD